MSFLCSDLRWLQYAIWTASLSSFFPHHIDEFFLIEQYWGVPFSTTKPLTWLSETSRAHTTHRSAKVALPIHVFCPWRIQVSPCRWAVVRSPPDAPDPQRGSVREKHRILLRA